MDAPDPRTFLDIFERSALAREVRVRAGASVFRQGGPGDSVYVVRTGALGIFRGRGEGRELIVNRGPGDLVGEMALFGHGRRSASLVALEQSSLLRIEAQQMLQLMNQEPRLAISINWLLAMRLQELMDLNLEAKNRQLEKSSEALEEAHRELKVIMDRANQGILCLDSGSEIRYGNRRAFDLLGSGVGKPLPSQSLPPAIRNCLGSGAGPEAISFQGRTLLVESEPLAGGGQVLFLTAGEQVSRLARALAERSAPYTVEDLWGSSRQIEAVRKFVLKAASTSSSVLIEGETGTGKELVAQAIHNASERWESPFIAVNCAAIPSELLESELFGYEKGAFTGALAQRQGKFELAQAGTIFLDEMGELPLAMQAKLLRVLQERRVHRLGGRRGIALDVRVLAATNRDLAASVAEGSFRRDLYYRIRVLSIRLPALRERSSDIPLLAHRFLERFTIRQGKPALRLAPRVLTTLSHHPWPGNVRELENAIERAVSLAEPSAEVLRRIELESVSGRKTSEEFGPIVTLVDLEQQAIRHALRITQGNVQKAAVALGISRASLFRKVRLYGIDRKSL